MKIPFFVGVLMSASSVFASAATCMVLGEKSARINAVEGERSPVFVTADCEALRLISGQALASWVGRDGKPRLIPIRKDGIAVVPQAGAEERSVTVVWNELTTRRERQQPAYMRSFGGDRAPKVYIPEAGLTLVEKTDSQTTFRLFKSLESGNELLKTQEFAAGNRVRVARSDFSPEQVYVIQIQRGDLMEEWKWRALPIAESASLDVRIGDIEKSVDVPEQRLMLQAMLFEQLKMRINMDFLVQQLRDQRSAY